MSHLGFQATRGTGGAAPQIPAFVISLARSEERRRATRSSLRALGVEASFIDAVDGERAGAFSDEARAAGARVQPHLGRALSAGEIGCLLSHITVLEMVARAAAPMACVLEDDCVLTRDFVGVLRVLPADPPWDLLLLGHHSARHGPREGAESCFHRARIAPGYHVARVAEFPMGAYAYVVTRNGAQRLAAYARPLRMPADWVTGYAPAAGVCAHLVTPPCVWTQGSCDAPTTIAGRDSGSGARGGRGVFRERGGRVLLLARKLGLWPDAYVKRF